MQTPTFPLLDPARDAAALLRRLGFAVLSAGLPVAALVSRRAVVVLFPIGVALLIVAAALDGAARPLQAVAGSLLSSPALVATAFAIGWALLSLAWTPDMRGAAERASGPLVTVALGLAAAFALPDRMRSANLYLLPIGVAFAAVLAIGLSIAGWGGPDDADGRNLERGVALTGLLLWSALAWLRSRNRDTGAILLALAATVAAGLAPDPALPIGLACGAVAYLLAFLLPRAGAAIVGAAMALVVVAAPALPLLAARGTAVLGARGATLKPSFDAWSAAIRSEPERLVTGHGIGAFLRARLTGVLPPGIPDSPLVLIWYDLGIVGALAIGAALWLGLLGARRSYAALLPGATGAFATAFTFACLGIGSGQAWWPIALVVVGLGFSSAERGQYRTRRPPAEAAAIA